jgi:murein DD-endopeptidase MepM/ murein hydrolase activator NlpD
MIDWNAAPEAAQLRAKNQPTDRQSVRLDRLAMSSRFGWRSDPITGIARHHAGIDLPGRFGSAVMATGPGTVRIAGWAGGYGNLVEIEHVGGVRTRYGHLSRLNVFPSEHVEAGQVIGEIGSTGHSTGPHLHFEVRVRGSAVDPLKFVSQRAPFVSQRAPVIDTVWGGDLHATSKWAWWSGTRGQALPEVSLR